MPNEGYRVRRGGPRTRPDAVPRQRAQTSAQLPDRRRPGGFTYGSGPTLAAAARDLSEKLTAQSGKAAHTEGVQACPYQVRYRTIGDQTEYGVWRQANGRWINVRKCDTTEEAQHYMRTQRDELDQWWERWRTIPATRRPGNTARTPAGRDSTDDPETFSRRFGFRGVQFGNWVEEDRRRADLNDTSQAAQRPGDGDGLAGPRPVAGRRAGTGVRSQGQGRRQPGAGALRAGPAGNRYLETAGTGNASPRVVPRPRPPRRDRSRGTERPVRHQRRGAGPSREPRPSPGAAEVRNGAARNAVRKTLGQAGPPASEVESLLGHDHRAGGTIIRGMDGAQAPEAGYPATTTS